MFTWLKRLVSGSQPTTPSACTGKPTDFNAVERQINNAFDSITEQNVTRRVEHASEYMIARYVDELASNVSEDAHEALVRIGSRAVPALVAVIRSTATPETLGFGPVGEEGGNAILTLERIGPQAREAIPALQAILDDPKESPLHKQLARSALRAIKR